MNGKQILSVVGMTLMLAAGNAVADEDGALDDVTARERRVEGLQTALDSIADAQDAASEAAENSGRADDILEDVPAPVDPGRP